MFQTPVGHTLRGVALDRSADADKFYVWVFCQPLCVPATSVYSNLGWRLGGETHLWNSKDPDLLNNLHAQLLKEGLPFLEKIRTPRDHQTRQTVRCYVSDFKNS